MSEKASDAPAEASEEEKGAETRSGTLKHGLDAREMALRSAASRRARAAERAAQDAQAATTFRQRVGIALSRLSQDELDKAVKGLAADGKAASLRALGALADQAFGKPAPEEEEQGGDDDVRALTRAQRSALIAELLREEEEQRRPSGEAADPRDDAPPPPAPPHPREA